MPRPKENDSHQVPEDDNKIDRSDTPPSALMVIEPGPSRSSAVHVSRQQENLAITAIVPMIQAVFARHLVV